MNYHIKVSSIEIDFLIFFRAIKAASKIDMAIMYFTVELTLNGF
jgi:hypothetical protein